MIFGTYGQTNCLFELDVVSSSLPVHCYVQKTHIWGSVDKLTLVSWFVTPEYSCARTTSTPQTTPNCNDMSGNLNQYNQI